MVAVGLFMTSIFRTISLIINIIINTITGLAVKRKRRALSVAKALLVFHHGLRLEKVKKGQKETP